MKLNCGNSNSANTTATPGSRKACLTSCQKIIKQLARSREALIAEAQRVGKTHQHLLLLALNEAESLAWQTLYPHLVFPALAAEKIEAVEAWDRRQELVREASPRLALGA